MSNHLCVSFCTDERIWTYDAVTNKIRGNKHSEKGGYFSESSFVTSSVGTDFCVEKMLFRTSQKQYFHELDSYMSHLTLEITQECTLRCSYCIYSGNYIGERTHCKKHMDLQTAMDAVLFFENHSKKTAKPVIGFYGGEALLQFDMIRQIVERSISLFHGRQIIFRISTNGTLLSDDVCKWLSENTNVIIDLTLNGYVHDLYRRFKSGEGSLSVIEKNLSNLRRNYPDVFNRQLCFICNYADGVELTEIIRYYMEQEIIPTLVTGIIRNGGNETIQSLGVSRQENLQAWDKLKESYRRHPTPYNRAVFDSSMLLIHKRSGFTLKNISYFEHCCFPFMTNCYADVSGQITLCEKMPGMERFGDIYSGVNKTKLIQLMKKYADLRNNYCRDCWAQRLCTRCFADMCDSSCFAESCEVIKQKILDDLIMYCSIYENSPELFASFSDIAAKSEEL